MIRKMTLFLIAISLTACYRKMHEQGGIKNKVYESKRGPLYYGNRFNFKADSSFIYIGHGPSVFLSKGTWYYDLSNDEVVLKSQPPTERFVNPKTIDTLWVDLSNKRAKLISKKRILFENILYYLQ